jgi:hypothetical protein
MKLMAYSQKKCWVFWMFFRAFISKKWWLIDKYGKFHPAISLDVLLYQSISHLSNLSMRGSHIIYQVAALAGTTQVTFPTLKSQYDATVPLHNVSQSCKTPWSSAAFLVMMWKWWVYESRWCDVDTWRAIHNSSFSWKVINILFDKPQ